MPAQLSWHWGVFPLTELEPIPQRRRLTVVGDGANPMGWTAGNPVIRARLHHRHDAASRRARRAGDTCPPHSGRRPLMKPGIHPDYHPVVFQDAATGAMFLTRSTIRSSRTIEWQTPDGCAAIHLSSLTSLLIRTRFGPGAPYRRQRWAGGKIPPPLRDSVTVHTGGDPALPVVSVAVLRTFALLAGAVRVPGARNHRNPWATAEFITG